MYLLGATKLLDFLYRWRKYQKVMFIENFHLPLEDLWLENV